MIHPHVILTDDVSEAISVSVTVYVTVCLFVIFAERSRLSMHSFGLTFARRYSCVSRKQIGLYWIHWNRLLIGPIDYPGLSLNTVSHQWN